MTYQPRPGTTAYRVMAALETLPHGSEVPASWLAERLGVPVSDIISPIAPAIEAGLIVVTKKNPHPNAPKKYSLAARAERRLVRRDPLSAMVDALAGEVAEALNDAAVAHARAVVKVRA